MANSTVETKTLSFLSDHTPSAISSLHCEQGCPATARLFSAVAEGDRQT